MKVVILAGGYGTRLSEETSVRPKPMVEIGGKPILWHIMKIYSAHGLHEFVICCGYRGFTIKQYFANYLLEQSSVTFDIRRNTMSIHDHAAEPWRVTLLDTGDRTMTGGRLKRAQDYIGDETFCMTYGDGVADIDIRRTIEFHRSQRTLATLTAVQPPGRFGAFTMDAHETRIERFMEKPTGEGIDAWINGGFFVLESRVLDYIEGDATVWEREPLERLARDGQLSAYKHPGFWQSMDTLRDRQVLEELWGRPQPPWKIW